MKKMQFVLAALLLVSMLVSGCGGGKVECTDEWGCAEIAKGQTIKVAYVGPMTGDNAQFGIDMSRGSEIAVKNMPQIKGFTVELLKEDTQGSPEQGASVANKLAADPQVVAISGHTFSGSTEAAMPIYEKAGIVMVSASATNPPLTKSGSQVFNRVCFTDDMQADFASKYVYNNLGKKSVAVMHDGGAYGKGLADMFAENFAKLGGTVVASEAITPGETDYSAPLAAIAAKNPELIYYGGYAAEAAVLTNQMDQAGLADAVIFGCDGTYGQEYLNLTGQNSEGDFSTNVPIPESDAFTTFRATYQATYGDEQGKLSPFSPHSHDSTAMLLAAIDKVATVQGDTLVIPRKALADAVRNTKDFQGLTGSLTCSSTGECAAASIVFMVVQGGTWVPGPGQ